MSYYIGTGPKYCQDCGAKIETTSGVVRWCNDCRIKHYRLRRRKAGRLARSRNRKKAGKKPLDPNRKKHGNSI